MGIFDAMNTSVGGLQAQSYALQNISGNIANSSTTGYKGIGTSFEDLIPDSSVPSKQVAGGVPTGSGLAAKSEGLRPPAARSVPVVAVELATVLGTDGKLAAD